MAKVRASRIPPPITKDEAHRLVTIADRAALEFQGNFEELESAVGMLFLGRLLGWKPLLIIHNRRTVAKYAEILGIDYKAEFPEVGPHAEKSRGYCYAQALSNFWKAVSGDTSVPNRREISKP
jgi:hypothetical protein